MLEEKNKDNIVKAIVKEKDELERNNVKLFKLLELKDQTLKAVFKEEGDIEMLKTEEEEKCERIWKKVRIEDLKDSKKRGELLEKYLA